MIKGRKSVISNLDASDFKATADMSKISITNAVPIAVTANSNSIAKKISITVVDNVLSVELEAEKSVSVPVKVVTTGEVATIRVTNSVNGEMVCAKKFEDYNEAMQYYSERFNNFKSAEEYETMLCAFKMFGLM